MTPELLPTEDLIIELFCKVDDRLNELDLNRKHSQADLYPSEVVTLALLFALKGVGNRAFYRWLLRDYTALFPKLPHRTRLFRLFNSHRHLCQAFMAEPSMLGVIDTYGIATGSLRCLVNGRSKRSVPGDSPGAQQQAPELQDRRRCEPDRGWVQPAVRRPDHPLFKGHRRGYRRRWVPGHRLRHFPRLGLHDDPEHQGPERGQGQRDL